MATQLLNNDPILHSMGLPQDNVFSANNFDTPAEKPFIVMRWTDRQESIRRAPSQPNLLDVWVYDEVGDYSRIDAMLARIRTIYDAVAGVRTSTGFITQIDWVGDGGDNYDDVWKAIARTATYRVIGSYLSS